MEPRTSNASVSRACADASRLNIDQTNAQWTFPDIKRLLNQIKKHLPNNDAIKYSTAIGLLDWNKLKFNSFTGAECKEKLLELLESTRCFRTLTEIINDSEKIFVFKEKGSANVRNEEFETEQATAPKTAVSVALSTPQQNPIEIQANTITLRNRVVLMDRQDANSQSAKTPKLFLNSRRSNDVQVAKNTEEMDVTRNEEVTLAEQEDEDNKFNVSLQNILKHTNWSQVVVNCGDKVNALKSLPTKKATGKTSNTTPKPRKRIFTRKAKTAKSSIKRPLVPFIQYFCAERKNLKRNYPDLNVNQLAAMAGQLYQQLPISQKEIYRQKYYAQKAVYDEKIKEIEKNGKRKSELEKDDVKKVKTSSEEFIDATEIAENVVINGAEEAETAETAETVGDCLTASEDILAPTVDIPIKAEKPEETDILANIQSTDVGRDYWGLLWYADENLGKLTHTKTEDKMDVMYNLWRSLEDDEMEEYIMKALKLPYESREKMQERVLSQVNMTSYTPKTTAK